MHRRKESIDPIDIQLIVFLLLLETCFDRVFDLQIHLKKVELLILKNSNSFFK
jgi:hypothetical protein